MWLTTAGSLYSAVGAASAQFADMAANKLYAFTTTTACFIKQGTNPTAAAAADNIAVGAGQTVYLHSGNGIKVAVIQAAAGGHATLSLVTVR